MLHEELRKEQQKSPQHFCQGLIVFHPSIVVRTKDILTAFRLFVIVEDYATAFIIVHEETRQIVTIGVVFFVNISNLLEVFSDYLFTFFLCHIVPSFHIWSVQCLMILSMSHWSVIGTEIFSMPSGEDLYAVP